MIKINKYLPLPEWYNWDSLKGDKFELTALST